jgi:hypothetical protein
MLARPIFRYLKTLPPRKNLFIYDYERLDPTNPHVVQGDEVTPEPGHTRFGLRTVLAILYLMAGTGAYAVTRLMYDYEWDRYYHIK